MLAILPPPPPHDMLCMVCHNFPTPTMRLCFLLFFQRQHGGACKSFNLHASPPPHTSSFIGTLMYRWRYTHCLQHGNIQTGCEKAPLHLHPPRYSLAKSWNYKSIGSTNAGRNKYALCVLPGIGTKQNERTHLKKKITKINSKTLTDLSEPSVMPFLLKVLL